YLFFPSTQDMKLVVHNPECSGISSIATIVPLLLVLIQCTEAVPFAGGGRMSPSWWKIIREEKQCVTSDECGASECCVRPLLSTANICMPLTSVGQHCTNQAYVFTPESQVFYHSCPCRSGLQCEPLNDVNVCVPHDPVLGEPVASARIMSPQSKTGLLHGLKLLFG
ncbi:unnamed protein product, partial [Meganyctiphanes norvegica]